MQNLQMIDVFAMVTCKYCKKRQVKAKRKVDLEGVLQLTNVFHLGI